MGWEHSRSITRAIRPLLKRASMLLSTVMSTACSFSASPARDIKAQITRGKEKGVAFVTELLG